MHPVRCSFMTVCQRSTEMHEIGLLFVPLLATCLRVALFFVQVIAFVAWPANAEQQESVASNSDSDSDALCRADKRCLQRFLRSMTDELSSAKQVPLCANAWMGCMVRAKSGTEQRQSVRRLGHVARSSTVLLLSCPLLHSVFQL